MNPSNIADCFQNSTWGYRLLSPDWMFLQYTYIHNNNVINNDSEEIQVEG